MPNVQKALVIISKILQTLANRGEFEPNRAHSRLIDTFVVSRMPKMATFIETLLVLYCPPLTI
jgi:hypothetical protein